MSVFTHFSWISIHLLRVGNTEKKNNFLADFYEEKTLAIDRVPSSPS